MPLADPRRAEEHIVRLLDGGSPVIIKQDFGSGSDGNEILGAPATWTCAAHAAHAPSRTGRRSPRTSPSAGTG